MGITQWIAATATAFIATTSYPGLFILMMMESMVFPVPSEAVMPFAGFLIEEGQMTFTGVIFFSTLGSIIGSLLSYAMGYYGGKPFIKRFGKFLLLDVHDLELTERFFARRGDLTIFIARFIPVVRHLISIPAGLGKMNLLKFCVYTIVGAGLWNAFLTYVGFKLKSNWDEVMKYSHTIDLVVIAILGGAFIYYLYKIYLSFNQKKTAS